MQAKDVVTVPFVCDGKRGKSLTLAGSRSFATTSETAKPDRIMVRMLYQSLREGGPHAASLFVSHPVIGYVERPCHERWLWRKHASSYDSPVCVGSYTLSVEGLQPNRPVDYLEFRSIPTLSGGTTAVLSSTGAKCSTAPNKPMCDGKLCRGDADDWLLSAVRRCVSGGGIIATRGQELIVVDSKAALDSFLAPYDTAQEALFAALSSGRYISCTDKSRGAVKQNGDGYDVVTYSGTGCGSSDPVKQYLLHVDSTGKVSEVDKVKLQPGRRVV